MDFKDLKKRKLKQKIRKLNNKKERWEIWQALTWLSHEGVSYYLDQIKGIEYLGFPNEEIDCVDYVIEKNKLEELIQGILEHKGEPKQGEIIIYGHNLRRPTHIGVWQEDGTVISKWGDEGPVIKHEWNKIIPDFGNYAFFSTYKGNRDRNRVCTLTK